MISNSLHSLLMLIWRLDFYLLIRVIINISLGASLVNRRKVEEKEGGANASSCFLSFWYFDNSAIRTRGGRSMGCLIGLGHRSAKLCTARGEKKLKALSHTCLTLGITILASDTYASHTTGSVDGWSVRSE